MPEIMRWSEIQEIRPLYSYIREILFFSHVYRGRQTGYVPDNPGNPYDFAYSGLFDRPRRAQHSRNLTISHRRVH